MCGHPSYRSLNDRTWRRLMVFGRLAPDASLRSANAEVATFAAAQAREYPETNRDVPFLVADFRIRCPPRSARCSRHARRGCLRASRGMCERREPDARARRWTDTRDRGAHGHRGGAIADHPPASRRKPAALDRRRHARTAHRLVGGAPLRPGGAPIGQTAVARLLRRRSRARLPHGDRARDHDPVRSGTCVAALEGADVGGIERRHAKPVAVEAAS